MIRTFIDKVKLHVANQLRYDNSQKNKQLMLSIKLKKWLSFLDMIKKIF